MKKLAYILSSIPLLTSLSACESTDLPIQHADGYEYINFTVETQKVESRANADSRAIAPTRANNYENYDPTLHPKEMGVFGYQDDAAATSNFIFSNTKVSYDETKTSWGYENPKKWSEYPNAKTFDFFAYMPLSTEAKVTTESNASSSCTLSIPFTMPSESSPFLYDTQAAPIICAKGEHRLVKDNEGNAKKFSPTINFQFDQTLTGYNLLFKLDPTMGAIRQFSIKKVSVTGDILTNGTLTRVYTYDATNQTWTGGAIQWNNATRKTFDSGFPIQLFHTSTNTASSTTAVSDPLTVTSKDFAQWGKTFYTIPDENFKPTISVTYDVELVKEDGSTVVTRQNVTSSIILNKDNFGSFNTNKPATINNIRILIQPRYLYVLADDDAYTGHLLIE